MPEQSFRRDGREGAPSVQYRPQHAGPGNARTQDAAGAGAGSGLG